MAENSSGDNVITFFAFFTSTFSQIKIRSGFKQLLSQLSKKYPDFAIPVITQYPTIAKTYQDFIKFPMDLRRIMSRMDQKTPHHYQYWGGVFRDVELIAGNCERFNKGNEHFTQLARDFRRRCYEGAAEQIFKVHALALSGSHADALDVLSKHFQPGETPSDFQAMRFRQDVPSLERIADVQDRILKLPGNAVGIIIRNAIIKSGISPSSIPPITTIDFAGNPQLFALVADDLKMYEQKLAAPSETRQPEKRPPERQPPERQPPKRQPPS
eukprot:gnl/Chilomastix_cuspidata/5882.p1 GENE.gnl/Chilomastix_cuspidata/5882~~gnl/Chilomastix_cuspidata/5882.p1  ORF type:complete len:270 (-),score=40.30 gnl/Chilomastix_cuspidata/5882:59-868(-)